MRKQTRYSNNKKTKINSVTAPWPKGRKGTGPARRGGSDVPRSKRSDRGCVPVQWRCGSATERSSLEPETRCPRNNFEQSPRTRPVPSGARLRLGPPSHRNRRQVGRVCPRGSRRVRLPQCPSVCLSVDFRVSRVCNLIRCVCVCVCECVCASRRHTQGRRWVGGRGGVPRFWFVSRFVSSFFSLVLFFYLKRRVQIRHNLDPPSPHFVSPPVFERIFFFFGSVRKKNTHTNAHTLKKKKNKQTKEQKDEIQRRIAADGAGRQQQRTGRRRVPAAGAEARRARPAREGRRRRHFGAQLVVLRRRDAGPVRRRRRPRRILRRRRAPRTFFRNILSKSLFLFKMTLRWFVCSSVSICFELNFSRKVQQKCQVFNSPGIVFAFITSRMWSNLGKISRTNFLALRNAIESSAQLRSSEAEVIQTCTDLCRDAL